MKPLHIVKLTASNILRLSSVEIVPDGDVVTLKGDNAAGKSSVLNLIAMILGGAEFVPPRPIREGASKANGIIDLGDIVAEIKFSASGKTIEVRSADGEKMKSPQAVLDSLWQKMCDPVQFIKLSDTTEGRRKQADILRKLSGVDFTALNKNRAEHFDQRTQVNRDLQKAEANLAQRKLDPTGPEKEVSVAGLMEQLEEAQNVNRSHEERRVAVKASVSTLQVEAKAIEGIEDHIAGLEKELELARKDLRDKQAGIVAAREVHDRLVEKVSALEDVDEAPLKLAVTHADEINRKVRANSDYRAAKAEVDKLKGLAQQHTTMIENCDESKSKMLAEAKFPMPGISFSDDDGVILNGKPFEQGSQAEQLVAAIAIGMALQPRVRVILIREASLFDDKTIEKVKELAKANDFQIWQERIESEDPCAILIEDGSVK